MHKNTLYFKTETLNFTQPHSDRAMECAMTNVDESLPKTTVGWAYQPNNETKYVLPEECMNYTPSPEFVIL